MQLKKKYEEVELDTRDPLQKETSTEYLNDTVSSTEIHASSKTKGLNPKLYYIKY